MDGRKSVRVRIIRSEGVFRREGGSGHRHWEGGIVGRLTLTEDISATRGSFIRTGWNWRCPLACGLCLKYPQSSKKIRMGDNRDYSRNC